MPLGDDPEIPADDEELKRWLRQIAAGPPRDPSRENSPWDFLLRRSDAELTGRLLPVARELLADPNPVVRRRAVDFTMNISADAAATVDRLLEVARRAELWGDQEVDGATLRERLSHALSNRAGSTAGSRDREIAAALARLAGDEPPSDVTAIVLAKHAADFAETATRRFAARPEAQRFCAGVAATFAVYHRDRLVRTLAGLRPLPAPLKQELLDGVASDLALPAETIRKLTAKAQLPAPVATPSLDDCRRALGL